MAVSLLKRATDTIRQRNRSPVSQKAETLSCPNINATAGHQSEQHKENLPVPSRSWVGFWSHSSIKPVQSDENMRCK